MSDDITLGLATGDDDTVRECADVWALAAAHRDGTEPDPRRALGGLRGRLRMRGADLVVALQEGTVIGFATLVPHDDELEVFHLATRPEAWGSGIAGRLLTAVENLAQARRISRLRLWVIEGNDRARAVYEHYGWTPTDTTAENDGRLERRYVKTLG